MIDTIMALWNQPPQRRGLKVFLTFLLICISISLLVAVASNIWQTHTNRAGQNNHAYHDATQAATETASISQVAVTATPTTVVIAQNCANSAQRAVQTPAQHSTTIAQRGPGSHQQTTPTVTSPHLHPTSPPTSKATPQLTPTSHVTPTLQPTATSVASPTTTPVPSPTAIPTTSPTVSAGATTTPTGATTPITPMPVTPTLPIVTPASSPVATAATVNPTPPGNVTPSATNQHNTSGQRQGSLSGGGPSTPPPVPPQTTPTRTGWTTDCTGDALLMPVDIATLATLQGAIGFVLAGSLAGTLLFYGVMFGIRRRRRSV